MEPNSMDHILVIPLFSRLLHRIINRAASRPFFCSLRHEDIFNGIYGSRVSYFSPSKFLLHSESSSLFLFLFCLCCCCLPICIKLALTGDELFRASPPPLDHKSWAVTLTDAYRNHRWCDVTVRGWFDLEWYLSDLWQIKWGYLSKSIIMWLWCSWLSWALVVRFDGSLVAIYRLTLMIHHNHPPPAKKECAPESFTQSCWRE